ncbi:carboxylesterase/lipase family protein [Microbacterium indicum]|uniref:carboxylesterase/lipase family protein n=1 Tax=Microbacterium indicum TaxID=358100 RepID=UPI0003F89C8B|nr:carboxylesterase family protein [Microbacterium indicum]
MTTHPIVQTTAGRVSGVPHPHGSAFFSIPFAAPPVGELRFQAPRPPEPWEGVRACDRYGATPQRRPFGDFLTTIPEPSIPGDDTLSLTVFTPSASPDAGLPVFVWVHGGGYFAGSPASPWYDGSAFARDGVVTVVISYRLGFDGFGWIEDAPLNRGVLDQIAALEWIRDNIAGFGGDPSRVTIAGQSAGGGSVLTLLASPRAAGLMHGVIAHSAADGAVPLAVAEAGGRGFAAAMGVEPTLAGWRSLTEDQVLDREREFNHTPGSIEFDASPADLVEAIRAPEPALGLLWAPVDDGETVVSPRLAFAAGAAADVPLVMGTTRNEFAFPSPTPLDDVLAALRSAGVSEAGMERYLVEVGVLGERFAQAQLAISQVFRAPLARNAALRSAHGAAERTWLFDFAHHSPVDGAAAHCLDVPFAWDVLAADGVDRVLGDAPQALADEMHADWVGFIRTGEMPWDPSAVGARTYGADAPYDPDDYALDAELAG